MPLPPRLEKELEELRRNHAVNTLEEGAWINIVLPTFPLGEGFTVHSSDLLLRLQPTYPDAGPDMFWLEKQVLLKNGQCPQNADLIEFYVGREWRRFSWHRCGWNPSIEDLSSYLEFVRRRLKDKR